ncbi:uncharacterized protein LOC120372182 [Mauremys reevesii]|uniref:uncharacterized protein LOC120372182 n=1 Tax=Mauremys reevesii TaxID=260615 RepID=UPI00193F5EBC|nr:uncharacterized protein LOC120372182 [Mauremys reevesii]
MLIFMLLDHSSTFNSADHERVLVHPRDLAGMKCPKSPLCCAPEEPLGRDSPCPEEFTVKRLKADRWIRHTSRAMGMQTSHLLTVPAPISERCRPLLCSAQLHGRDAPLEVCAVHESGRESSAVRSRKLEIGVCRAGEDRARPCKVSCGCICSVMGQYHRLMPRAMAWEPHSLLCLILSDLGWKTLLSIRKIRNLRLPHPSRRPQPPGCRAAKLIENPPSKIMCLT